MSNDPPDDGQESPPSDLDNVVQFKKPSGSQNRAVAAAAPTAKGMPPLDGFNDEVVKQFRRLGPPPLKDPRELILWQQQAASLVQWAYMVGEIGPDQHIRLKGILESVRTGGMIAVKSLGAKLQRKVAKRLGVTEEEGDDGLDDYPGGKTS